MKNVPPSNFVWRRLIGVLLTVALPFFSPRVFADDTLTVDDYRQDFDVLWETLHAKYAYFDEKQTDWNRVREVYRPRIDEIRDTPQFIGFLEKVLDELYDAHTQLRINTPQSPRLVPSGLDFWAEWIGGRAIVTQMRTGFSAEQAGLKVGMEIVSLNGVPIADAAQRRLGACLKREDDAARSWTLLSALAGTHDVPRVVEARNGAELSKSFALDLSQHRTADNAPNPVPIESERMRGNVGYIKVNNLGSAETVREFDAALEQLKSTRGVVLDLRATQNGGNTSVAEPIMGRFVTQPAPYQQGQPVGGARWTRSVSPRGNWTYRAPMVVLVDRWTASMGEGIAIGFDAMHRATVVGTRMAGLNGTVFDLELPNTKIRLSYAAEKLFHMSGTPREKFLPPVLVRVDKMNSEGDAVLEAGLDTLKAAIESTR